MKNLLPVSYTHLDVYKRQSYIINAMLSLKQRILTSATAMQDIPAFTKLKNPVYIDFLKDAAIVPDLKLKKVHTTAEDKLDTLLQLICKIGSKTTLIFCNHRETVDRISDCLLYTSRCV